MLGGQSVAVLGSCKRTERQLCHWRVPAGDSGTQAPSLLSWLPDCHEVSGCLCHAHCSDASFATGPKTMWPIWNHRLKQIFPPFKLIIPGNPSQYQKSNKHKPLNNPWVKEEIQWISILDTKNISKIVIKLFDSYLFYIYMIKKKSWNLVIWT